jgi:WD40 repeat protein
MNLARVAWDENNLERTRELLDKHRPKPGEVDLRGFEWHYLRRLFHGDMLTIKAHGGWVTGVAFRPDGKCLVTSGTMEPPRGMKFFKGVTSEIKLWDAATGQPLRFQLSGPTGAVDRMALFDDKLPQIALNWDGTLVAAHYSNHAIRVLNLVTGDLVTLEGPAKHSVAGFNFSHDGKRLVSVYLVDGPTLDSPSLIKIWDLATGKALLTLDQLPHVVGGPSISPNGRHLAAAFSHLGVVKVWDATTGNEAYSCKYAGGLVYHAIFSPDGKRLAASGDKGVQFWDAGTHEPGAALPSDSRLVLGMAFSPDGKRLATGSVEGAVDVWDTRSGQKFWTFKGHSGNVIWLSFSSDGARLATGGADGTVRVWDTSGQRDAVSITKADSTLEQPELSPDGQTLLSWGPRKIVRLWDSATGKPRGGPIEIPQTEVSHDWSGDGKRLYLADAGKTIRVVDTVSGKVIRTFQVDAEAKEYDIAISADEKWCAHPGPGNTIKVRNVQTGALLRTLKVVDERGLLLVFSPNGSRLLGLDQDGVLKFWEVATGNEIATTRLSDMYITHTRFSPDGKRLAVVGNLSQFATGEVRILDAENLREIWSLKGHTLNVLDVAFSPDGQRLATASADRTARIWDLTTGKEILKLSGYPRLWSLRFVSNGRRLIIASTDLTIHVWDATPMPDEGSAEARNR